MDLNTAQQLSLIQRNLESAQLNIDSATELLNVVIQKIELDDQASPLPAAKTVSPKKKLGRPVTKKEVTAPVVQKKAVAKKAVTKKVANPVIKTAEPSDVLDDADLDELVPAPKTATGVTAAIREYVKHHSDNFTADDLVQWGKEHGYFFSRIQYASNLSWMANREGYPVGKTGKGGIFKPAA